MNSKLLKSINFQFDKKKMFFLMIILFLLLFIFILNIYLFFLQENIDYKKQNFDYSLYGKKYAHEFDDLEFKIFLANKKKKIFY